MIELVVATQNRKKLIEIQRLFSTTSVHLILPEDIGVPAEFDVAETGTTFAENAQLKAVAFGKRTQHLTVADDSGICVDALDGRPGVYSKRFIPGSDQDRYIEMLRVLAHEQHRAAHFVCTLCLYDPKQDTVKFFEGRVDGQISQEARGTGMGYDPIFVPDGYDRTFGELEHQIKDAIGHRGRAVRTLQTYLESL